MNAVVILLVVVLIALGVAFSQGMIKFGGESEPEAGAGAGAEADPDPPPQQDRAPEISTDLTESIFPNDISGLSGRYTTNSFDPDIREWRDVSGKENDITIFKGTVKKSSDFVHGTTNDGMKLPTSIFGDENKYTFFWVARYNGATTKNIFEGVNNDWLSGFYDGKTAQAKHGEWITDEMSTSGLYSWVQGTDAPNKFRVLGVNKMNDPSIYGTTSQITVNMGPSNEMSDWAIKEMIVYDRLLTLDEIKSVEEYLLITYFPDMPENISIAKGIVNENIIADDPRGIPEGWGTKEYCRAQAKELGYPIWGHTKESEDITKSNKCFYYPENAFDTFEENEDDESNVIGCVASGREITDGCKIIDP